MRNHALQLTVENKNAMSQINYRLMSFVNEWVLWAEGVPVARFDSKRAGLCAAELRRMAASRRGDETTLIVEKRLERDWRAPVR